MNKGITLITLIITCIVIMILVGATTMIGFDIVEKAEQQETNKQLTAVGNAVLEQYTKYIKTKDTTYLIGTKYKKTDSYIQETINKVGIELVQIPSNYAEDLVSYYQLSTLQLKQMGIEDSKYTYIVNYLTGEVINQTKALAGEKYYMYSRSYFDGNITDVQEVVGDKIRIAITPTTWTSTNVTVYLSYVGEIPTGYVIQYKKGNETWTTGNKLTVETNNTTVYARLYKSDSNDEMGITSKTITNIDKTAPTAPTEIESSATTNSITVQARGGTDGESGIAGYQYSTNGTSWTGTIAEGESYTFEGIKAGTEVTIYAKTVDNAGQISTEYQEIVNTTGVEENVTLTSSIPEGTWTSGDVTVTLSYGNIPSGYELQYKVGSGSWTTGTSALVTQNNTTVYGRLYNATLDDEIAVNSITITNIDKEAPTAPTGITSSVTINSITVTASGGTDSLSGVVGYQYRINGGAWSGTIASGTSHTFSGLTAATNYTIEVRTVDKVGITSSAYTKVIQSGSIKITGITLANKTLTKTGTTNPTVTITPTITPSNATNKGVTWSSSNPAVATVNASGVVTYVKEGTTIITATAQDGSGIKGTCTVTCTENIKVTGISLFHPTLFPESPTYTIVPQITPSNATNKGVS